MEGKSSTLPVVVRPSRAWWAAAASLNGSSRPTRSFRRPARIQPRTSSALDVSSSLVTIVKQGRAGQIKRALRVQDCRIERWNRAARLAEEDHHAAAGQRVETLVERSPAYPVIHHLDAPSGGEAPDLGREVLLVVEDDLVGSGLAGEAGLVLRRGGGEDAGAQTTDKL